MKKNKNERTILMNNFIMDNLEDLVIGRIQRSRVKFQAPHSYFNSYLISVFFIIISSLKATGFN